MRVSLRARTSKTNEKARALQSAQHDLERQRATDGLRKGLEGRPERDELENRTSPPSLIHSILSDLHPFTLPPLNTLPSRL